MSFNYETLLVQVQDKVATVTVNRPGFLNALNNQVYSDLLAALTQLDENQEVRAIIITGSGEKAFIAGADISEMKDMTAQQARSFALKAKKVSQVIEESGKPVLAAVHGFALGGGCELAMSCDLILATKDSKFGQPETNLGIIPGNGGTQRLVRLVGLAKGKELILLGDIISAAEAKELGLVNKLVETQEELLAEANSWAQKLAAKSQSAIALAKYAMNRGADVDLNTGLHYEIECFAHCFTTADQKEGMTAFLERRKPNFE